jgi:hypothetical protein
LESLLIVAASHPSLPNSIREAVAVAQGAAAPPAPAVNTSASTPAQAPPSKPSTKKATTKPTTQAAPPSTPAVATAPAAAAAAPPASSPPAQTLAEKTLLQTTTDAVIALANDYSRDQALAILGKRRGITRCSELLPDEVQGVLDEATAAYEIAKTAKANSSLV